MRTKSSLQRQRQIWCWLATAAVCTPCHMEHKARRICLSGALTCFDFGGEGLWTQVWRQGARVFHCLRVCRAYRDAPSTFLIHCLPLRPFHSSMLPSFHHFYHFTSIISYRSYHDSIMILSWFFHDSFRLMFERNSLGNDPVDVSSSWEAAASKVVQTMATAERQSSEKVQNDQKSSNIWDINRCHIHQTIIDNHIR